MITKVQFLIESGRYDKVTEQTESIKALMQKFPIKVKRSVLAEYLIKETNKSLQWAYKFIKKLVANNHARIEKVSTNPSESDMIIWQ